MTLHHESSGRDGAPVLRMGGSVGTTLKMRDGHDVAGPAAHLRAVEQPEAVNQLISEHMR